MTKLSGSTPPCAYNRHTNLFPNPESREEKNDDTLADPPYMNLFPQVILLSPESREEK